VLDPAGSERTGPSQPFGLRQRQGRLSPPSAPAACLQNAAGQLPVVSGGVARDQVSRVVDRIGGRREGRGSPEGFFAVERGSTAGKGRRQAGVGSPVGFERLGRKYLVAWCLGWGRDGRRRAGAGCLQWLGSATKEWRR
jgi:hypothetical protein